MQPIARSTWLGIVDISFALAVAQLAWGTVQPVFGTWADKTGPGRGVLLVAGMAPAPVFASPWGLVFTLGLLAAAGAGSFPVLIGGHRAPGR